MKLGVTPNLRGYEYIISGIEILSEDIHKSITKEVYPRIAKQHNSTSSRVERCMRSCILSLFNTYESVQNLMDIFGVALVSDHLTNSQFLCLCADTIKHNLEEL